MSKVLNFISVESISSKVKQEVIVTIRPNWNHKYLKSFFCEKFNLPSTTRISEKEFIAALNCLLFIRIDSDNPDYRLKLENLLRSCLLPKGFQDIVKFLPLGGTLYQFKSHQVRFVLSDELVDSIKTGIETQSLTYELSELSRHLSSNQNAIKESFNYNFLTSEGKYFILNSYFSKNTFSKVFNESDFVLNLCTKSPELTCGIALSIIFGFTCEADSDIDSFLGIVAESGMSVSDLNVNARLSFDYFLRDNKKGGPTFGLDNVTNVSNSGKDSSPILNSPSTQSFSPPNNIVRKFISKTLLPKGSMDRRETDRDRELNSLCLSTLLMWMKVFKNDLEKLGIVGIST
jgi:hypothetical protein